MIITCKIKNKIIHCQSTFDNESMRNVLLNIDEAVQTPLKVLKDDNTSTVVLIRVGNQSVIVKRSNIKNLLHPFKRLFRRSRARKNWTNAEKLLSLGIPTFQPIALVEEQWGLFKGRSYFLCTYIEGIRAIEYFHKNTQPNPDWPKVVENIAQLVLLLEKHGICHRDLNLSNIILKGEEPWLIDLDAMRFQHFGVFSKHLAKRERARLLQNCRQVPEVSPAVVPLLQSVFSQLDMC